MRRLESLPFVTASLKEESKQRSELAELSHCATRALLLQGSLQSLLDCGIAAAANFLAEHTTTGAGMRSAFCIDSTTAAVGQLGVVLASSCVRPFIA